MKIQCNVCELAEANVLCCADEAALCWSCDDKVHAANKLASKHQRVPLTTTSSSNIPNCDVCQETMGYFFCLEDRALLCRKCDVAIHTANNLVSSHQRFLLTGVKVGLEPAEPGPSSYPEKSHSNNGKPSEMDSLVVPVDNELVPTSGVSQDSHPLCRSNIPMLSDGRLNKMQPVQMGEVEDFSQTRLPISGGSAVGTISHWQLDDFLGLSDFNLSYMGNGSSKADNGKLEDSDDSSILRACEEELDGEDSLGQVPDSHWAVPQVPSPPTASGLHWPKIDQSPLNAAVFVPDICDSPLQNHYQPNGSSLKRRRQM